MTMAIVCMFLVQYHLFLSHVPDPLMLLVLGISHFKWVLILRHYAVLHSELMSGDQSFSIFLDFLHKFSIDN